MSDKSFPMSSEEIRKWDGKAGRVVNGDPTQSVVPVWVTLEGTISVLDDETISVTPIPKYAGATVAPYPGNGRIPMALVKEIKAL